MKMGTTPSLWRYDPASLPHAPSGKTATVYTSVLRRVASLFIIGLAPNLGAWYLLSMRIIARRTLREFVERRRGYKDHGTPKAAMDAWFDEVRKARWSSAAEVRRSYATASIVSADRIVFNVKGNDYRLVVAVDFEKGIVWIKWIGTHKDYDKIDVKEVQHEG